MTGIKYENCFGDKRIDERGNQLHGSLFRSATRSIQAMAGSRAEQKFHFATSLTNEMDIPIPFLVRQ